MKLNFFTLLGGALLIGAIIVYSNGSSFRGKALLTTGTVTGMSQSTNSEDLTSYCPQISFTAQSGTQVTYHSNICSTSPQYENGDQVDIYYDPENPEQAQVKSFWTQFGIVTLLGGIGLPLLVIGILGGMPSGRKST